MRHSSAAAALLAPAVAGALGLSPAAAHAQNAPPAARAAWIKACYDNKHQESLPCGHWRLRLRDGRDAVVRGAAGRGIDGKGRAGAFAGVFAISADGRVMAYERAGDHRLVVRRTAGGPVTELPPAARPKGVGSDEIDLSLSPSGDRVLIDYFDAPDRLPTKVITVATGSITALSPKHGALGFSADGDEVLTTRTLSDNTTAMYAHRLGGGVIRRTPPTLVINAATHAPAADGTTVALFTTSEKKPPRVRTYDLATGRLSAGAELPLKPDATPYLAWWDAGGRLTATVRTGEEGKTAVVRVLTVDPATGTATQADKYTIGSKGSTFVLAGE
ncbi:hypothetical protein [Nonomuraea sp. NPDC049709]|uniref:hypothetical protein n=1 Tax=Nonomuraea sp. NPDC049709 TaxID=3154736 RepID=UPI00341F9551